MSHSKDVTLSKSLSRILRHKAREEKLSIDEEGYIKVSDILQHKFFKGKYTVEDIQRIVSTNDKQRFSLRANNGVLEICANQGHSIPGIDKLNLKPICELQSFDVIHGTYFNNWVKIKVEGLSRMTRNHIHFATGLPADGAVISGMRRNCQVYIYINLALALAEGLKFYMSANEVILSPGDRNGVISPRYFVKVCNCLGQVLL